MKKNIKHWLFYVLVLFMVACSKDDKASSEVKAFIAAIKNKVTLTKKVPDIHFRKTPQKLPDQIVSPFPQTAAILLNPALLPLERYPLSALHLMGVVVQNKSPFAVLMAPDKKMYSIHVGDQVGSEKGEVTAILPYKVVIVEPPNASAGATTAKTVILQLQGSSDL